MKAKLIDSLLSGVLSGAIGGMSGGFLFAVAGSVWVLIRDAGPAASLPTLFASLAIGLLGGSILGLVIGGSAVIVGVNRRWPLIGGLIGAMIGPLPLVGIAQSFALELNSASLFGLVLAGLTGCLGGIVGGFIFKYRYRLNNPG